jgi:ATP-dependent DNA helicase DinG
VIEVEVHRQLNAFLKHQGERPWPHHLTIARLVARALRLRRSALIQITPLAAYQGRYRLSYLVPLLLCGQTAILVLPDEQRGQVLLGDVPQFRDWLERHTPVYTAQSWPGDEAAGLLLLSPQEWLADVWSACPRFPQDCPVLVDGADQLEDWARQQLQVTLSPADWEQLTWVYPAIADQIRTLRARLTQWLFQRPSNPYEAYSLEEPALDLLQTLHQTLARSPVPMPNAWATLWTALADPDALAWITLNRARGEFAIAAAPATVEERLAPLWERLTTVMVGSSFGSTEDLSLFRQRVGLPAHTSVQFGPEHPLEAIPLYLPDGIPLPNTPEFHQALVQEMLPLILLGGNAKRPVVVLVEEIPLKTQVAAQLAATFGSRVTVETKDLQADSILVCGWQFWRTYQPQLPAPSLLMIATLPIPSPENPTVAARIAQFKRQQQDWFRHYLLPEALRTLQRAIAPVRSSNTVVVLFDNRVLHRSYGHQVLAALSPYARITHRAELPFHSLSCGTVEV